MKPKETLKVAYYIRVSSEEQAENPEGSIKSQEQRLRGTLDLKNMDGDWGKCVGTYVEQPLSGKDTNRPELQKLLAAIERREVTLVMVTELSRLTRAMKDFCSIKELMDRCGCTMMSLRENFDSSTAAGELVMYLMASMSQFERKQISERVGANFLARSQRGLYNGGCVPIGYKLIPEKRGFLAIDREQAGTVTAAFNTFLEQGTLSKTAVYLNEKGYRHRPVKEGGASPKRGVGHFTFKNVYDLLTNPSYAGVRRFRNKGEIQQVKASWEPIIDHETFERVQALLKKNHCRGKPHEKQRYPFSLAGLTVCHECKVRMPGKSAHGNGGKIPYYDHSSQTKRYQCVKEKPKPCRPQRVQAKLIEPQVWEMVMDVLRKPEFAKSIIEDAKKRSAGEIEAMEDTPMRARLLGLDRKIETLTERLSELPREVSAEPIYLQMRRLGEEKKDLERKLQEVGLRQVHPRMPVHFNSYAALLDGLRKITSNAVTADAKAKVIQALVHQVEVKKDGIRVHFYAGDQEIRRAKEGPKGGLFESEKNSLFDGSNSLCIGAG
jgi:site-specific DNA recombinase